MIEQPSPKPNYPVACAIFLIVVLGIAAFVWLVIQHDRAPLPPPWSADATTETTQ